jgi:hypothetical protein
VVSPNKSGEANVKFSPVKAQDNRQKKDDIVLLIVTILIAAVVGTFWVGLIAAWDHHDEPSHFQYIRRLVDEDHLPIPGEENWKLNRQILKSMIWNGFFERMNLKPVLSAPKEPIYFPGYSQYTEPPAYYYAASLAVRLLLTENITRQMFGARLVSLFFFLLTVVAAWGTAREITSYGHPLRWMLPLSVAFFPTLIDIMTAVNNDSGSIAVVSFFIWVCVRLIKKGFNLFDFFSGIVLSILAWYMKSTAALVIPLFPVALLFSILRDKQRVIAWSLIIFILICGLGLAFTLDDAAFYYRSTAMTEPTRIRNTQAVLGDWVLQIDDSEGTTPVWMPSIFQPVPFVRTLPVVGQKVTLGFWMWADQDTEARTPGLATETEAWYRTVQLTQTPIFYTVEGTIDDKARLWLSIDPFQDNPGNNVVYLDGMVLVAGARPLDQPPVFADVTAESGAWGGEPFINLLRNGSFENASIRMRNLPDNLIARFYPDQIRPSFMLMSLFDREGVGWYYNLVFRNLIDTFSGYFGWDHIHFNPPILIRILEYLLVIGFGGALVGLFVYRKMVNWEIVFFLSLAIIGALIATVPRGIVFLAFPKIYVPVARYIMPVIIPILICINMGWVWICRLILRISQKGNSKQVGDRLSYSTLGFVFYCFVCFAINLTAIISIWRYYGGYHLFM